MDVQLLYVPGCSNIDWARRQLREALGAAGVSATIRESEVATPEAAALVGMRGSPTILIDGRDPFAASDVEASFSCRLVPADGSTEGPTSVNRLIAALQENDRA